MFTRCPHKWRAGEVTCTYRILTLQSYRLGREELRMLAFLLGVVLGAIIAFLGPSLLPQQFRNAFVDSALRVIGVLAILFAIASTSFVRVPDGYLGQLFRVYGGGSLPQSRIVAVHREEGPQAQILTPRLPPLVLLHHPYHRALSKPPGSIPPS